MEVSPGVAQRDLGTSTVSLTGLPPLMRRTRSVNTREAAKREGRARSRRSKAARPVRAGGTDTGSSRVLVGVCQPTGDDYRLTTEGPTQAKGRAGR
jgi:hypothetical protein